MSGQIASSRNENDLERLASSTPSHTQLLADHQIRFGILESFIGFHLRLANDRAFEHFTDLLGPDRLRPGCFTMLTLIANNPGITQVAIGKASGRDKSSVTKALRYMEDKGLIHRERLDGDRRSYASYVTEAGFALSKRMEHKARLHIDDLLDIIGDVRHDVFLSTLRDLIAKLPRCATPRGDFETPCIQD